MIERVTNPSFLQALVIMNAPSIQIEPGWPAAEWLSDPRNIALVEEYDLAMFEHRGPGMVSGHIWFSSRGAKAVRRAKAMLEMIDCEIIGEVPTWRKDVQRFVTGLGFKPIGAASRPMGNVVVFSRPAFANLQPARLVA